MTNGWTLSRRRLALDRWHDYRDLHFSLYPLRGRLSDCGYVLEVTDRHGRLVRRRVGVARSSGGIQVLDVPDAIRVLRQERKHTGLAQQTPDGLVAGHGAAAR